MEWIRVEDQLPDINKWVLTAAKEDETNYPLFMAIGRRMYYDNENGPIVWRLIGYGTADFTYGFLNITVTHWMPFPALPEEKHAYQNKEEED